MNEEKGKFQYSALKFVYEMELVDDPQLINNMKLNIFNVSRHIMDVELLSSYHTKSMLVFIDLTWFGKLLRKRIEVDVLDRVQQLLPNFKFRVVSDRKILDMSLEKVKTALKGGINDKVSDEPVDGTGSESGPSSGT